MGTRGLLGIRNNKELVIGRFNNFDSYYESMGEETIDLYFQDRGEDIINLTDNESDERDFLEDGLFCEYAYIYNRDNDTLEIYRGWFKYKQNSGIKERIVKVISEGNGEKKSYYCHLIMIVDKNKHTKKQILKSFLEYDKNNEEDIREYPEREIIPLEINDDYVFLV